MNPAGALHIQVRWDGAAVVGVALASTRPRAAQFLVGTSPDQAMARLPLLYSICSRAQQSAGQAALAAARGQFAKADPLAACTILCEATQEHLWRLLFDWPQLLGLAALERDFAHWHRRLAASAKFTSLAEIQAQLAGFTAFVESVVLGMPGAVWRDLDDAAAIKPGTSLAGDLWHALREQPAPGGGNVACLPAAAAAEFADSCTAGWNQDFERCPTWHGDPAETGALARWQSQPLVAAQLKRHGRAVRPRLLARLMDLAQCAGYIAAPEQLLAGSLVDAFAAEPGVGIARVETARGTLLHRVSLEVHAGQERVREYSVVAPTEWNFHPRGAFAAAVQGLRFAGEAELRQQTRQLILAFDPCIACQLELTAGP